MTDHNAANVYDAIVVGARCGGSPTAMLLARLGYKTLVVDRAHFPSDTVSTHLIHPPGVAILDRWQLLDRLVASGCPPINTYSFDFGPVTIRGNPRPSDGAATSYCPRRTVLDQLLVSAAREAGAEIREGVTVDELLIEGGTVVGVRGHAGDGSQMVERARVVIGADGAHSRVARAVTAAPYHDKPVLSVAYYSYWSGIPVDSASWVVRPGQGFAAFPTNDGLTMLLAAWPYVEYQTVKKDIEGNYLRAVQSAFGDRLDAAHREERVVGGGVPHDAELCVAALDEAFNGSRSFDDAMVDYQRSRDARVLPVYEFTAQIASLEPPPPELQQLLGAIDGNAEAMNEFASLFAGTVSPADFFDPAHIGRLVGSPG
jgi:2-polyprenyl-6-methoxyphenol hydroxylase-like FAD-dependent oxidoreductase